MNLMRSIVLSSCALLAALNAQVRPLVAELPIERRTLERTFVAGPPESPDLSATVDGFGSPARISFISDQGSGRLASPGFSYPTSIPVQGPLLESDGFRFLLVAYDESTARARLLDLRCSMTQEVILVHRDLDIGDARIVSSALVGGSLVYRTENGGVYARLFDRSSGVLAAPNALALPSSYPDLDGHHDWFSFFVSDDGQATTLRKVTGGEWTFDATGGSWSVAFDPLPTQPAPREYPQIRSILGSNALEPLVLRGPAGNFTIRDTVTGDEQSWSFSGGGVWETFDVWPRLIPGHRHVIDTPSRRSIAITLANRYGDLVGPQGYHLAPVLPAFGLNCIGNENFNVSCPAYLAGDVGYEDIVAVTLGMAVTAPDVVAPISESGPFAILTSQAVTPPIVRELSPDHRFVDFNVVVPVPDNGGLVGQMVWFQFLGQVVHSSHPGRVGSVLVSDVASLRIVANESAAVARTTSSLDARAEWLDSVVDSRLGHFLVQRALRAIRR